MLMSATGLSESVVIAVDGAKDRSGNAAVLSVQVRPIVKTSSEFVAQPRLRFLRRTSAVKFPVQLP